MRYQISHLIKGDAKEYHENLSNVLAKAYKLHPVTSRIDAHLTLKSPFDAIGQDLNDLEKIIADFAGKHSKQPYALKGFGRFEDRVIYMDVESPGETKELVKAFQEELKQLFWMDFRDYEKEPELHATLCYPRSKAQADDMFERLTARGGKEIGAYIDSIAILKRGERRWEVYKEFPLGGGDDLGDSVTI